MMCRAPLIFVHTTIKRTIFSLLNVMKLIKLNKINNFNMCTTKEFEKK
jgi:hypothetical protein